MTNVVAGMFEMGAAPALEHAMRFAEMRHRLILSNVANADTPGYLRQDGDLARFQRVLADALEARDRGARGGFARRPELSAPEIHRRGFAPGSTPPFPGVDGPLRHDENDVSIEREMALLAHNAGRYTSYSALLGKAYRQISAAIAERPGEG